MLLIVTLAGIAGAIVFGIRGVSLGASGELDQILAIACVFMTAAGVLGSFIDDGRRGGKRPVLTREEQVHVLVAIPLALLMVGVFLITLIPSIYVMLPFFVVWHYTSRPQPAETPPRPAPEPAFAH